MTRALTLGQLKRRSKRKDCPRLHCFYCGHALATSKDYVTKEAFIQWWTEDGTLHSKPTGEYYEALPDSLKHLKYLAWDHKIPRSRGGSDLADNLTPACWECNTAKSDRTVEEYRQLMQIKTGIVPFLFWGEQGGF